jgi:response regulator NasT
MQTTALATAKMRVVVVEDDEAIRLGLVQALEQTFQHEVVGQASSGPQMVEVVLRTQPDVVVFDIHLPGQDGLTALKQITEQYSVAAVAISADRDLEMIRRASEEQVLAYLIKPFEHFQLGPALQVAKARFEQMRGLASENDRLQQTLENRKLVERAKGVLMKRHRWTEAEAFRRLQRAAMNRRTTMAELARKVMDGVEVDL